MKNFHLDTRVRLGEGALDALDEFADGTAFVVTDDFLATTDHFAQVLAKLPHHVVFDGVKPNPTTDVVAQGVTQYLKAQPTIVVAYGGGSSMDTAKAVHKVALEQGRGAPEGIIAIPTTSGSGSEVTSYAVITDEKTQTKIPLVSKDLVAHLAILDPEAVRGVPPKTTADSGMDVLTHATEAYVSINACDFSDALAEKAFRIVTDCLLRCYTHGDDLEARAHMHNASTLAAAAFDNVGLGITHSIAHALGGHFHVAHGRLNAILLPHVIEFNAQASERAAERYAILGRIVAKDSVGKAAIRMLVSEVRRLNQRLDIPEHLADAGVDRAVCLQRIDELTETAIADTCTATNPAQVTTRDLAAIIKAAL